MDPNPREDAMIVDEETSQPQLESVPVSSILTLASRVASSQLSTLELIAKSRKDYENIAVKLGNDRVQ